MPNLIFCPAMRWLGRLMLGVSISALLLLPTDRASAQDKLRETPYQGFGASTPAGSAKTTIRVTNLNDSGPGSLRDAVSKGNRTVVFDVAGEIVLGRTVDVRGPFITIDGFTAPSPGITLKRFGLSINGERGGHDVIVRGIRIREAGISTDKRESDGISVIRNAHNVVIDHVSIQGSEDGNLDIGTGSHDVTVSWSVLAEPRGEQKNMLIKFNPARVTLHHNIFVRSRHRNPQVAIDNAGTPASTTTVDFRNNIVWDWDGGYGTMIWYGARANVVNNFYSSPRSSNKDQKQALVVGEHEGTGNKARADARVYASGNLSGDNLPEDINNSGNENKPFPAAPVDTQETCAGARAVLAGAGVRPLDSIDQRYLSAISLTACSGKPAD